MRVDKCVSCLWSCLVYHIQLWLSCDCDCDFVHNLLALFSSLEVILSAHAGPAFSIRLPPLDVLLPSTHLPCWSLQLDGDLSQFLQLLLDSWTGNKEVILCLHWYFIKSKTSLSGLLKCVCLLKFKYHFWDFRAAFKTWFSHKQDRRWNYLLFLLYVRTSKISLSFNPFSQITFLVKQ